MALTQPQAAAKESVFFDIRRAARTTCVKPEGTASLLLGAGSGIHPHHAPRYFRRVQVNRQDPVYRHFKALNPGMTEPSVYSPVNYLGLAESEDATKLADIVACAGGACEL